MRPADVPREEQFDLLTAALLGIALGAGATLLLRTGPRGRRPIGMMASGVAQGARMAGRAGMAAVPIAREHGQRGLRWTRERGEDLMEMLPVEEIREQMHDYLEAAQSAINDAVEFELDDLRKAIRRQRKKLGL